MAHAPRMHDYHERPPWQWWTLACWIVATFALGAIGFWKYEVAHAGHASLSDSLYHAAQLFVLHAPALQPPTNAYFELGRWMAVILAWSAAVVTARRLFAGEYRTRLLRFRKAHTIVAGEGQLALDLLDHHCAHYRRQPLVVISRGDGAVIRHAYDLGATVLLGQPETLLGRAGLHRAERFVAVYDDDAENIALAARASALKEQSKKTGARLQCYARVHNQSLRETARRSRLFGAHERCDVRFFDPHTNDEAVRRLLRESLPLDHDGITVNDRRRVLLVIVGFGATGRSVALHAAQIGHFANAARLQMVLIDADADERGPAFVNDCPALSEVADVAFVRAAPRSPDAAALVKELCDAPHTAASVVVCLDDDVTAVEVASRMFPPLADDVRVAVQLSHAHGHADLLRSMERASPIRLFGWCDEECFTRVLKSDAREEMAALVHGNFLELAERHGRDYARDEAIRSWEQLTNDDYRESSRQQVDHFPIKLRAVGCEEAPLSDPRPAVTWDQSKFDFTRLAELEHRRWVAERRLAGWHYAPGKKNPQLRTNPNIRAWEELSDDVQAYDFVAVASIPKILEMTRRKICRRIV